MPLYVINCVQQVPLYPVIHDALPESNYYSNDEAAWLSVSCRHLISDSRLKAELITLKCVLVPLLAVMASTLTP